MSEPTTTTPDLSAALDAAREMIAASQSCIQCRGTGTRPNYGRDFQGKRDSSKIVGMEPCADTRHKTAAVAEALLAAVAENERIKTESHGWTSETKAHFYRQAELFGTLQQQHRALQGERDLLKAALIRVGERITAEGDPFSGDDQELMAIVRRGLTGKDQL